MLITINEKSGKSIYEQIVWQVEQLVYLGVLSKGDRLPSVRDLAVEISVNPNTVAKAYTHLENSGVIYSVRGRGTFISGDVREDIVKEEKKAAALLEEAVMTLLFSGKEAAAVCEWADKVVREVIAKNQKEADA
jgi:GntR family transcriptional regulator